MIDPKELCQKIECKHFNNTEGLAEPLRHLSGILIDSGLMVCGYCGCSIAGMNAMGKACPLGYTGENKGIYAKLKGSKPKGSRK